MTANIDIGTDQVDSQVAEAAGLFNLTTGDVEYSQNLFGQMYPASTTKILTAYIILKYGNTDDMVTVSDTAVDQESDSSVCGLKSGDVISVYDLLRGMMLVSGNDAAVALAEYFSGSVDAFAERMNEEAHTLGATGTHYVNPNGMPDDNHYTCVYDMYLMFSAALQLPEFVDLISTASYEASYTDADGAAVTQTWNNTNRFTNGKVTVADGFTAIGGKTGTTNSAGYCLVQYAQNEQGDDLVSIVFKADGPSDLYLLTNELFSTFGKS